jgi:glyoxylase-like metal-dependent hydrolase (beta-lactamase superfamily II)
VTIQSHQRSAWRLRRHAHVPVWAPLHADGLEEEPDHWYRHGDLLPGGLVALHAPGPCDASYVLWAPRTHRLFVGDMLTRGQRGGFSFVPGQYMDDPRLARESVRALLDLPVVSLCSGHGAPLAAGGRAAIRRALADDEETLSATPP